AYGIARQYNLIPPVMEQSQYNMFHRERLEQRIAPLAKELGLGLTTFSPLHSGVLTGKYNNGIPEGSRASLDSMAWIKNLLTPKRLSIVQELELISAELGITQAQLAIAWLLRRKEVSSVITGATRLSQLQDNLGAAHAVDLLSDDVLDEIDAILEDVPE
ncbi:MAG: aldo/keto reductase, partial [Chloroflexota bacterium]|nr:aldo/keto reductase [Chloroflexota bacterium]